MVGALAARLVVSASEGVLEQFEIIVVLQHLERTSVAQVAPDADRTWSRQGAEQPARGQYPLDDAL
jgi:hypothetical protein